LSLRGRLTLAGGGAVLVALAIASSVIYLAVRSNLHQQIDTSLISLAQAVSAKWNLANLQQPTSSPRAAALRKLAAAASAGQQPTTSPHAGIFGSDASGYFQVIPHVRGADGGGPGPAGSGKAAVATLQQSSPDGFVPLIDLDMTVARGLAPPYFRDARYHGVSLRLYTMSLSSSGDGVVRAARPLTESNATIARIRWLLLVLTFGGALVAAALGRLAANPVLRPVRALAEAVRHVSATRDLNRRIPVGGRDELGSLAADFNAMLQALDESLRAQQHLIADASHELRTPLTAHRANVELLARPDLPVEQRERVLGAAVRTMEKLSALVGDLIEAAREGRSVDAREPLALEELVAEAVQRAQHRAPDLRFESELQQERTVGSKSRLERAVDNVLDNAIKWSTSGGTIEVRLDDGALTVRDHGPGIGQDDLPHVFDRFYRAAAARALPGSGLGPAIVKQTVEDHGGSVSAMNADGGGATITLRFGTGNACL